MVKKSLYKSVAWTQFLLSQNTQKKNFLSPQQELNPWPSRYRLDTLTTELWETIAMVS